MKKVWPIKSFLGERSRKEKLHELHTFHFRINIIMLYPIQDKHGTFVYYNF